MKRIIYLISIILCILLFSNCQKSNEEQLNANKELIKKFTELLNKKQFDQLNTIMKLEFKRHSQATAEMPELNSLDEFIKLQEG